MNPPDHTTLRRRRRILLAVLFSLLGAWLVLHYLYMLDEQERFERRMLTVDSIEVRALPPATTPVEDGAESAIEASLANGLRAVSSCLATANASRAPATLTIALDADAHLKNALWSLGDKENLGEDDRGCLAQALESITWPTASAPLEATITLVPIASR